MVSDCNTGHQAETSWFIVPKYCAALGRRYDGSMSEWTDEKGAQSKLDKTRASPSLRANVAIEPELLHGIFRRGACHRPATSGGTRWLLAMTISADLHIDCADLLDLAMHDIAGHTRETPSQVPVIMMSPG